MANIPPGIPSRPNILSNQKEKTNSKSDGVVKSNSSNTNYLSEIGRQDHNPNQRLSSSAIGKDSNLRTAINDALTHAQSSNDVDEVARVVASGEYTIGRMEAYGDEFSRQWGGIQEELEKSIKQEQEGHKAFREQCVSFQNEMDKTRSTVNTVKDNLCNGLSGLDKELEEIENALKSQNSTSNINNELVEQKKQQLESKISNKMEQVNQAKSSLMNQSQKTIDSVIDTNSTIKKSINQTEETISLINNFETTHLRDNKPDTAFQHVSRNISDFMHSVKDGLKDLYSSISTWVQPKIDGLLRLLHLK